MQGKRNKLLKPLALTNFTLSIFSSLYIFRDSDTPPLPLLCQYFPAFRNSVMLSRMSLTLLHLLRSVVLSSLSFSHFTFRQRKPFTYRPVFLIVFTFPLQATETIYMLSSLPYRFHISSSLSFSHFPSWQQKPFICHPVFLIIFNILYSGNKNLLSVFINGDPK